MADMRNISPADIKGMAEQDERSRNKAILVIVVLLVIVGAALAALIVLKASEGRPKPGVVDRTVTETVSAIGDPRGEPVSVPGVSVPEPDMSRTDASVPVSVSVPGTTTPVPATTVPAVIKQLPSYSVSNADAAVFAEINNCRGQNGLANFSLDAKLSALAYVRCTELAQTFSHTRPNGSQYNTVFEEYGIGYNKVSESILSGTGVDATGAVSTLFANEWDRNNLLSDINDASRVGIANFESGGTYYFTVLFYS